MLLNLSTASRELCLYFGMVGHIKSPLVTRIQQDHWSSFPVGVDDLVFKFVSLLKSQLLSASIHVIAAFVVFSVLQKFSTGFKYEV